MSDLAGTYGSQVVEWFEEPTYELIVGLWLNKERQLYRQGVAVATGIGFAFQGNKLGSQLAEGLAENEEQEMSIKTMAKETHGGNAPRRSRFTKGN